MSDRSSEPSSRRRTKRRWLQFRLRSFLALIAMMAVTMGVWFHYVKPFQLQAEAAARLREINATIGTETGVPTWISEVFGPERFQNVVSVNLEHCGFQQSDLAPLRDLPHLRRLYLAGSAINDEGLIELQGLGNLQRVSLWGTRISNHGVANLSRLPALEVLDVHRTKVTEDVLVDLEGAASLKRIIFDFTLSDIGLARLASFPNLRRHHFVRMNLREVTGHGLRALTWFPSVEYVNIANSELTDADLVYLGRLPNLRELRLYHTCADELALRTLAKIPFKRLSVAGNGIRFRELSEAYGDRIRFVVIHPRGAVLGSHSSFKGAVLGGSSRGGLIPTEIAFNIPLSDQDLSSVADLPVLFGLSLMGSSTAEGLFAKLQQPRLEEFSSEASLSNEALRQIGNWTGLKYLCLRKQKPDAASLSALAKLIYLEELALTGSGLDDEQLAFLNPLTALRILDLSRNRLQGPGLASITGMTRLEELWLFNCTAFGDEGMPYLAALPSLQVLNLQGTLVTDQGIKHLYEMPFLTDVYLSDDHVTKQVQARLKTFLSR